MGKNKPHNPLICLRTSDNDLSYLCLRWRNTLIRLRGPSWRLMHAMSGWSPTIWSNTPWCLKMLSIWSRCLLVHHPPLLVSLWCHLTGSSTLLQEALAKIFCPNLQSGTSMPNCMNFIWLSLLGWRSTRQSHELRRPLQVFKIPQSCRLRLVIYLIRIRAQCRFSIPRLIWSRLSNNPVIFLPGKLGNYIAVRLTRSE